MKNIGFGENSTHTMNYNSILSNIQTKEMNTIIHQNNVFQDKIADQYTFNHFFRENLKIKLNYYRLKPVGSKSTESTFTG